MITWSVALATRCRWALEIDKRRVSIAPARAPSKNSAAGLWAEILGCPPHGFLYPRFSPCKNVAPSAHPCTRPTRGERAIFRNSDFCFIILLAVLIDRLNPNFFLSLRRKHVMTIQSIYPHRLITVSFSFFSKFRFDLILCIPTVTL